MHTLILMSAVFAPILLFLAFMANILPQKSLGTFLPSIHNNSKREYEIFTLYYSLFWISIFGIVIVFQLYENFTANSYMSLCSGLAAPLLLQPIVYPMKSEQVLPLHLRYSFKATLWIAIFSFIGNYFYTHYFYSVLQAKYTFPCHRTNNVPIALFFATYFYFVTYHTFSNLLLRKIETRYHESFLRTIFFWAVVCAFAYFTAFMETLTISSFPYYSFPPELKQRIYTHGSAFYGIYFLASFPLFYRIDEKVSTRNNTYPHTILQTILESMGCGMIVLIMLDMCRLYLEIPLVMSGKPFELTNS